MIKINLKEEYLDDELIRIFEKLSEDINKQLGNNIHIKNRFDNSKISVYGFLIEKEYYNYTLFCSDLIEEKELIINEFFRLSSRAKVEGVTGKYNNKSSKK